MITYKKIYLYDNPPWRGMKREKVGAYFYSYGKPYQLAQMDVYPFTSPPNPQEVTYNAMMRPLTIKERGYTVTFTYSSDYKRTSMNVQNGNSHVLTRYYIGGNYEIDVKGEASTQRLYLGGDAYSAPAVYYQGKIYNICRDYLGSVTLIVNNLGGLVERNSYDAWGRPRDPQTHEPYPVNNQPEFFLGRGYTGHEHIKPLCLINMNARLYAPLLGRFLSPDPYVQAPDFTQNFNRYAYCLNNPLAFTDQDGEFWNFIIGGLVGGLVNWMSHGFKFNAKGLGYFAAGAAIGALSGGIGGLTSSATKALGALPGALIGGGTGAASGAATSFLLTGTNNLIGGQKFMFGMGSNVLSGTLSGLVSGALTGGIKGYKNAAAKGVNRWTGAKTSYRSYNKPFKIGIAGQPDPTKGCYANALEYADKGHYNTPSQTFINAAGGADGADVFKIAQDVLTEANVNQTLISSNDIIKWTQLGGELQRGAEIIGSVNQGNNTFHAVNIVSIKIADKLKLFGGGIKSILKGTIIRDPLGGIFTEGPCSFTKITWIKY